MDQSHPITNPFLSVFSESNGKTKLQQIEMAVEMLLESMNQPPNPRLQKSWPNLLQAISGEDLAHGFYAASLKNDGFPKMKEITSPIFERQFTADYAWLLTNLKRHRKEWKNWGPILGPYRRIPGGTPDDVYPRVVLEPMIPAPAIPERIKAALVTFGNGSLERGLANLDKHPDMERWEWDANEAMRYRKQIDDGFRAAWMTARLGGSQ
jgi:hypothetical protein